MRRQAIIGSCVLLGAVVAISFAATQVNGQAPSTAAEAWSAPRTPWGDPDLQGIWFFGTITPLERPASMADREFLTPEEVAEINRDAATRGDRRSEDKQEDLNAAYNQFWWDRGLSTGRTSLIVDPENGRLPPYTPEGRQRRAAEAERGYDSWKDRTLNERCLVYRPVPVRSTGYNNNALIVQAPGYVTMLQEQIHEVRIIPVDGRPHIGSAIRPWLGDPRGRWDGDTLVVETTNFHPENVYLGSGEHRHVVERFTRIDKETLKYEFTVTDPTTWTAPWSAEWPWQLTEGPIFEYACHEGNYGMVNLLAGERKLEAEAAAAARTRSR